MCIHELKHWQPQSRNAKLLLLIIPIGIVAYAQSTLDSTGQLLSKQLYTTEKAVLYHYLYKLEAQRRYFQICYQP